nr:immunoglobulin light chain junction region [Macaca mulatta]
CMQSTKDWTF